MLYRPVPRGDILDALVHIRDLYRRIKPSSESDVRAHERREAVIRDLLSNLPRIGDHPTLKTLLQVANVSSLTLEGVHRLFGYHLSAIREYDLRINGGRTHIVESYSFQRDLPINLPSRLAADKSFASDALLRDLVPEWQSHIPIRVLEEKGWHQPGAFYVHVGTEDSLGSGIPAGALVLVEPIGKEEQSHPNPRSIYLLQFGNGYRCSHCIVTPGRLRLFSSARTYLGREEFIYPGSVRIAGRIRMFATSLPIPEYPSLRLLPPCRQCADLILPWEHASREQLLATEHQRFKRSKDNDLSIREFLKAELNTKLSDRSERRYRSATSSGPHVNALIALTLSYVARYTDSLRTGGSLFSDKNRFSLESLLSAKSLDEALIKYHGTHLPTESSVWEARRKEFGEWPPLLSMTFPNLPQWDSRVIRLAEGCAVTGLNPMIAPGSLMLLEELSSAPNPAKEWKTAGWSRPIYMLHQGLQMICGYLERDGTQFALLNNPVTRESKAVFGANELSSLRRVVGIAVPL